MAVIYARVSEDLKQATDSFASSQRITLASAVGVLIERGLLAPDLADQNARLEQEVTRLAAEVESAKESIDEMRRSGAALEESNRSLAAAYEAAAGSLRQRVGTCPTCRKPVTGRDLFVSGACPNCSADLRSLFGSPKELDRTQYLVLLGALGLLLGIALLQGNRD